MEKQSLFAKATLTDWLGILFFSFGSLVGVTQYIASVAADTTNLGANQDAFQRETERRMSKLEGSVYQQDKRLIIVEENQKQLTQAVKENSETNKEVVKAVNSLNTALARQQGAIGAM